eukprot:366227-Chlamydomonas_euryale.AAC.15
MRPHLTARLHMCPQSCRGSGVLSSRFSLEDDALVCAQLCGGPDDHVYVDMGGQDALELRAKHIPMKKRGHTRATVRSLLCAFACACVCDLLCLFFTWRLGSHACMLPSAGGDHPVGGSRHESPWPSRPPENHTGPVSAQGATHPKFRRAPYRLSCCKAERQAQVLGGSHTVLMTHHLDACIGIGRIAEDYTNNAALTTGSKWFGFI